ncbi:TPA: hypothetical protein QDZ75_004155 [Stenotrophomonas maltophilia]|nr:hypothetical protein [Stenotrophomonas maltophilia]
MADRFPGEQPRFDQPVVDQSGRVTQAWANYFLRLASVQSSDDLRALYEALAARVAALEDGESADFQILGQGSVSVNGVPQPGNVVVITLAGDIASPGNTQYYGTGPTGTKGWFPVSGTITVAAGELTKTVGADGVTTFGLANVSDSGTGTLLATTFDAKGRKTGTRPATITGTPQQIDVTNGNAAAGLPTLTLAPEVLSALAEAGTALQPGDVAGPNSVKVTPNGSGGIILQLDNDQATPAALTEYSTNSAGVRGWWRPALFESTGVINGGALSINAGNNARFDMAQAVIGYTDWSVTPTQPTRVLLTVGPFSAQVVTNIATANATYVGIQMPGGTIVQQTSPFTNAQRRTIAQIGVLVHSNNTNLNAINDQAATIRAGVNQVGDLMAAIGPLNLTGNIYSANGNNLNINKTGGSIFKMGSNFQANNLDPHVVSQGSQTALTFRYRLSNGVEGADTTSINPNQYESAPGVLTAIPILGNQWHVQRISLFQSGLTRIQYGQQLYASAQAAINGITTDTFTTEQNIAENGILRCYLIINRGLLGLLGSATFAPVSKFGAIQAGSGSAPDHNNLSGLQGGSSTERYHATAAQNSSLAVLAVSGYIDGMQMGYASGSSLSFSSGAMAIQSSGLILQFPTTITKSGISLGANSWGHCYGFSNAGVPDVEVVSTAPSAPYIGTARSKTGDSTRRYIGSVRTDGSGAIIPFGHKVQGGEIKYRNSVAANQILNNGMASTATNVDASTRLPVTSTLIEVFAETGPGDVAFISNPDVNADPIAGVLFFLRASQQIYGTLETSSTQQLNYALTPAVSGLSIYCCGYTYAR